MRVEDGRLPTLRRDSSTHERLRGSYTIKATVSAEDGSVVTENAYDFDVFSEQDLAVPAAQIAVLDLNGPLDPLSEEARHRRRRI